MVDAILRRAAGGESILSICRDEKMPGEQTVWRWIWEDEAFRQEYVRAISARSLVHADRIQDLVERAERGEISIDVAKLSLDAAKWTAARLLPKIYGDKQEVTVDVTHTHVMHLEALKTLSDMQRAKRASQVIDMSVNPTIGGQLLESPWAQALPAEAAGAPPARPATGAAAVATTTPRPHKNKKTKPPSHPSRSPAKKTKKQNPEPRA